MKVISKVYGSEHIHSSGCNAREKCEKVYRTDQSNVAREAYIIYEPCPD